MGREPLMRLPGSAPAWVFVLSLLAACRSTPSIPPEQSAQDAGQSALPDGDLSNPADVHDVDAVAKQVYDFAEEESTALAGTLGSIYKGLGIPIIPTDDTMEQRLRDPRAIVFDVELELIAEGLRKGGVVTLESVIRQVNALTSSSAIPPAPLTLESLTEAASQLLSKADLSPQDRVPALVLALGRERARRLSASSADPVWGDRLLDPLQFHLLMQALGRDVSPPAIATSGSLNREVRQTRSRYFIDDVSQAVDILKDLSCSVGCLIYAMLSAELKTSVTPYDGTVYRKSDDGSLPSRLEMSVSLTSKYDATMDEALYLRACTCDADRRKGPLTSRQLVWEPDAAAKAYGSMKESSKATNESGVGTAVYETNYETTPKSRRIILRGTREFSCQAAKIEVGVLDWIPNYPSLEYYLRSSLRYLFAPPKGVFDFKVCRINTLQLTVGGELTGCSAKYSQTATTRFFYSMHELGRFELFTNDGIVYGQSPLAMLSGDDSVNYGMIYIAPEGFCSAPILNCDLGGSCGDPYCSDRSDHQCQASFFEVVISPQEPNPVILTLYPYNGVVETINSWEPDCEPIGPWVRWTGVENLLMSDLKLADASGEEGCLRMHYRPETCTGGDIVFAVGPDDPASDCVAK
jgi:hypothetical protein